MLLLLLLLLLLSLSLFRDKAHIDCSIGGHCSALSGFSTFIYYYCNRRTYQDKVMIRVYVGWKVLLPAMYQDEINEYFIFTINDNVVR